MDPDTEASLTFAPVTKEDKKLGRVAIMSTLRVCPYCGLFVRRHEWSGSFAVQSYHDDCLAEKTRHIKAHA